MWAGKRAHCKIFEKKKEKRKEMNHVALKLLAHQSYVGEKWQEKKTQSVNLIYYSYKQVCLTKG